MTIPDAASLLRELRAYIFNDMEPGSLILGPLLNRAIAFITAAQERGPDNSDGTLGDAIIAARPELSAPTQDDERAAMEWLTERDVCQDNALSWSGNYSMADSDVQSLAALISSRRHAPAKPEMDREELRIVFDGHPSHDGPRFVEVEDATGKSVNIGEWRKREDGYWEFALSHFAVPQGCIPDAVGDVEDFIPHDFIEDHIRELKWASDAPDELRTYVAGNIRGFAVAAREQINKVGFGWVLSAQAEADIKKMEQDNLAGGMTTKDMVVGASAISEVPHGWMRGFKQQTLAEADAYIVGVEDAAALFEMINPASDTERLRGDPGAGAMGAIIEYRDKIRALLLPLPQEPQS